MTKSASHAFAGRMDGMDFLLTYVNMHMASCYPAQSGRMDALDSSLCVSVCDLNVLAVKKHTLWLYNVVQPISGTCDAGILIDGTFIAKIFEGCLHAI